MRYDFVLFFGVFLLLKIGVKNSCIFSDLEALFINLVYIGVILF